MEKLDKALEIAVKARSNAYAPYSGFSVGAALALKNSDTIYAGANVENASYGGTICAERSAIVSAIASEGKTEFDFCVVSTNAEPASVPCALCLQVFSEFCPPDFPIYLAGPKGIEKKVLLKELLPVPFNEIPEQGLHPEEIENWIRTLSAAERLSVFEALSEYLSTRELTAVMERVSSGTDLYEVHRRMGLLRKYYVDLIRIRGMLRL